MNSRLLIVLIIFPIWLTLVIVFRKQRHWLVYYLLAAFGLTIQLVLLAEYFGLDQILVNAASYHVKLISDFLFNFNIELLSNGRLQMINAAGGSDILKLGIECSAVLESSVIFSLIIFYPLFNWRQKIIRSMLGLIATYVINLFRIIIILLMADEFGSDYIFLAHAGLARIFFFICELLLYWYLITKPTVKSIGDSIKKDLPLSETAKTGLSFQSINTAIQIIVIITILGLSIYSFEISDEWRKAFAPTARKQRPIIYQDETDLEAEALKPSSKKLENILGEKVQTIILEHLNIENLLSQNEINHKFKIESAGKLNILIISGDEPMNLEIYLNGVLQNSHYIPLSSVDKSISNKFILDNPLDVKFDDEIEIIFKNIGNKNAKYEIDIIKEVVGE